MEVASNTNIFERLGGPVSAKSGSWNGGNRQKVCFDWRDGRCNRFHCPYLHAEPSGGSCTASSIRPSRHDHDGGYRKNPNFSNSMVRPDLSKQQKQGQGMKICRYWVQGSCKFGEKCKFLHSWYKGDESFSLLTQLEGHEKAVSGIALPTGSDKLYTGSKDGTVRVWDCNSGQSAGVCNLGSEIECMISEGPWIFVGLKDLVRVWNSETNSDFSLEGPAGRVYALEVFADMLFAGVEDGSILVWKFNAATNKFDPAASLKGHTSAVVTMVIGANKLYSGSMDNSIRKWSLDNFECQETLTEHKDVVMSVLCWDQFLLSCSLDKTIKVWAATESGNLEAVYTHNEEQGLLKLCGMYDAENKPVLLCSLNDNIVRIYDLPSFKERGKIFAKEEVRAIKNGPGGIFFTGDGIGPVRVWKWEEVKS